MCGGDEKLPAFATMSSARVRLPRRMLTCGRRP
jgi:hypothetical protein